uniref:Uncharacterized protein n=1 Tax=viral metagenome TaxID=1070528 RepID=A0A6H1ZXN1_9ZZZZ
MKTKKQFKRTGKPPVHYDRKVLRYGYSAMISMGHLIPKNWDYARVTPLKQTDTILEVRIERLRVVKNNAPDTKVGEKREPNTQRTGPISRGEHSSRKS